MDLRTIRSEDWQAFREQFPSAYSFLLSASLKGEEIALKAELPHAHDKRRRTWIEARLADFARIREAFWSLYPTEENK
jgi:hypothetical protein